MRRMVFVIAGLIAVILFMSFNIGISLAQQKDPAAARKAAEERARVSLGVKEWNVESRPTDPLSKAKPWSDTLILADGKLTSKHLAEKGFLTSNITVTVEGGLIIWETMQRSAKGEIAFWRGELAGTNMGGVVSIKPVEGETEEFSFVSVTPPAPKPEEPAKAEAKGKEAQQKKEETKKKR